MDLLTRQSNESALDVLSRAALMLECGSAAAAAAHARHQSGNTIRYHSGVLSLSLNSTIPASL